MICMLAHWCKYHLGQGYTFRTGPDHEMISMCLAKAWAFGNNTFSLPLHCLLIWLKATVEGASAGESFAF